MTKLEKQEGLKFKSSGIVAPGVRLFELLFLSLREDLNYVIF